MNEDVEYQLKAFEDMLFRYFGISDKEKAISAYVFFVTATSGFEEPNEEDIAWARKELGID